MLCNFKTLCFLLCLTMVKNDNVQLNKLPRFQQSIGSSTKVQNFQYASLSNVEIKNVKCTVYFYNEMNLDNHKDENSMNDEEPYSKSTRFYSCLNCEFANWLNNKLFKLIVSHPELYREIFQLTYIESNQIDTEKTTAKTLDEIDRHTQIFISIIFNFLDVYKYVSLLDTSLLKLLVSLQFKINDIRTFIMNPVPDRITDKSKNSVILKILKSLNDLQQFKALNCNSPSITLEYSHFFGYSKSYVDVSYDEDMKNLLINIEPMIYLYDPRSDHCDVNKMLLNNDLITDGQISKEISRISITLSCSSQTFSIGEIQRKIIGMDDLEVIHWYQNIAFNSVLKLLYTKLYIFHSSKYDTNIFKKITDSFQTLSFLLDNVRLLPKPLITYFELISHHTFEDPLQDDKLAEFMDFVKTNYVEKTIVTTPDFPDSIVWLDHNVSFSSPSNLKPEEFLDEIIQKLDDYKYFTRLLEFLTFEVLTHRTKNTAKLNAFINEKLCKINSDDQLTATRYPSAVSYYPHNPLTSNSPENDRKLIDQGCNLVYIVYQICYETFITLNIIDENYLHENVEYKKKLADNVNSIVSYLHIFEITYNWDPFEKISSNLVQVWVLLDNWLIWNDCRSMLARFFYLVLTEFNDFGIDFCSHNCLSFDKIDFDAIGLKNNPDQNLMILLAENRLKLDLNYLADPPAIKILTRLLERKSHFIDSYTNVISIYWKGERKSMVDIYRSLILTVSSPYYTYAVLDVYLKYAIAVFFYQTNVLFTRYCQYYSHRGTEGNPHVMPEQLRVLESKTLSTDHFPKRYYGLISNFNLYFKKKFADAKKMDTKLCTANIDGESVALLGRFGVFIAANKERKPYFGNAEGIFLKRCYQQKYYSLMFKVSKISEPPQSFSERSTRDYNLESDIKVFNDTTNSLLDDIKQLNIID